MGHTEEAPYDAIHVGAAAPVVPQAVSALFLCESLISLLWKCCIFFHWNTGRAIQLGSWVHAHKHTHAMLKLVSK